MRVFLSWFILYSICLYWNCSRLTKICCKLLYIVVKIASKSILHNGPKIWNSLSINKYVNNDISNLSCFSYFYQTYYTHVYWSIHVTHYQMLWCSVNKFKVEVTKNVQIKYLSIAQERNIVEMLDWCQLILKVLYMTLWPWTNSVWRSPRSKLWRNIS